MALLGTLKGFGVTEIFQLISQQMKTGSLILTSPKGKVSIAFHDGYIRGIICDRWDIDPRAELLLNAGIITTKELKAAVENEKKSQSTWAELLISKGKLQKVFLDKANMTQIRTMLLDVFQWGEGAYRFEDWDQNTDGMLTCELATESVILDTLRVIDEWPIIKPKIPAMDYLPVTIATVTEQHVKRFDLGEVDLHIFDLIDGEKSVGTVVRESLETNFDSLNAFVKLIDAGLVEVFPRGAKDDRDHALARQMAIRKFKRAMVYIVLAACVSGLLYVSKPRIIGPTYIPQVIKELIADQKELGKRFVKPAKKPLKTGTDTNTH